MAEPSDRVVWDLLDRRTALLSSDGAVDPELERVTDELGARLASSVPRVRRLTPDEPGDLLERLVAQEPVHPFAGPADVSDRLAEDRRCFVLEHPSLPGRPMNVVWVALWTGVPSSISAILDSDAPTTDPRLADTAVFYSIWNVEPGLVGLPGGRPLLAGAIEALRAELPGLTTFVTLSPVPGFREWATARQVEPAPGTELLRRCAEYLMSIGDDGRLIDPVARFHLANGARLIRLSLDADHSERGLQRSWGVMANYRYEPEDRAANRAALRDGRPAVSAEIEHLLREPRASAL